MQNLNQLELNDELTAVLVTLRFAIMTFCLVGLAKWFNRQQLSLVFVSVFIYKKIGNLAHK
jgi:hypothetical protein